MGQRWGLRWGLLPLELLLRLSVIDGWTTISQQARGALLSNIKLQFGDPNSARLNNVAVSARLGYLWNDLDVQPPSSDNPSPQDSGLYGGISYAFDPTMCSQLLPKFGESAIFVDLVTCNTMKAAITRGFALWSENNAKLNFIDMTGECEQMGDLTPTCSLIQ